MPHSAHHIGTIINFSTNEARFLGACIEEAKKFSEQVIVTVCDHFFDGVPENRALLESIYAAHPEVEFVEFPFGPHYGPAHWHNMGRLMGWAHAGAETLLFLDVDEIMEGEVFSRWLNGFPYRDYEALRLACYWYFREACYRSREWEDTPLLIKRSALSYELLMHTWERAGSFASVKGAKARRVLSLDGLPMCHHYSWVRTKEQMLRKVRSWGHRDECDWESLVEKEFSQPFSGRDFVYGYDLEEVAPRLRETKVRKLRSQECAKIEIDLRLQGYD